MSAPARTDDRERGFTLVELLVAITLLAVATTLLTVLVVQLTRTFTAQEAQQDSSRTASVAMAQVGRVIRGGTEVPRATNWQPTPVFEAARRSSLVVNAYVDTATTGTGPTRVSIALDTATGDLVETRWAARRSGGDWVYDATPSRTRVLVRDVQAQGAPTADGPAPALFTYLRADGTPIAVTATGALTELQRREVVAVCVSLVVQTAAGGTADPAQLSSTFSIPNLGLTRADTLGAAGSGVPCSGS